MNESVKNPFEPFFDEIRRIVREEIRAAFKSDGNGKSLAEKDWLKAEELAELYGLPRTWFEERGRQGLIERSKAGRYVLFKRRDVEAFLEKKKC